jgi:hypothetical protein
MKILLAKLDNPCANQSMNTLQATVQELGFPTIEEFARFHALDILEHKLVMYEKQLGNFQQKYGVEFQEFEKNASVISKHGILEKEDDFIEWESILHSSKAVQKKIVELKTETQIASKIDYRKKLEDYFQNV